MTLYDSVNNMCLSKSAWRTRFAIPKQCRRKTVQSIGEHGVGLEGGYPQLKKFFYDPPMTPLAFKTTPTPSEMAFDPYPVFVFFRKKILEEKKFRRLAPAPVFVLKSLKKKFMTSPPSKIF